MACRRNGEQCRGRCLAELPLTFQAMPYSIPQTSLNKPLADALEPLGDLHSFTAEMDGRDVFGSATVSSLDSSFGSTIVRRRDPIPSFDEPQLPVSFIAPLNTGKKLVVKKKGFPSAPYPSPPTSDAHKLRHSVSAQFHTSATPLPVQKPNMGLAMADMPLDDSNGIRTASTLGPSAKLGLVDYLGHVVQKRTPSRPVKQGTIGRNASTRSDIRFRIDDDEKIVETLQPQSWRNAPGATTKWPRTMSHAKSMTGLRHKESFRDLGELGATTVSHGKDYWASSLGRSKFPFAKDPVERRSMTMASSRRSSSSRGPIPTFTAQEAHATDLPTATTRTLSTRFSTNNLHAPDSTATMRLGTPSTPTTLPRPLRTSKSINVLDASKYLRQPKVEPQSDSEEGCLTGNEADDEEMARPSNPTPRASRRRLNTDKRWEEGEKLDSVKRLTKKRSKWTLPEGYPAMPKPTFLFSGSEVK